MPGTGAGNNQPLRACSHCRLGEIVIIARIGVEDGDLGKCGDLGEIKLGLRGVPADRRTIVDDAVRIRVAEDANLRDWKASTRYVLVLVTSRDA